MLDQKSLRADHGPHTWKAAWESVVVVNPTWPGFDRPGFGAPPGTAPAGSGFYYDFRGNKDSNYVLTAAHVVTRAVSIEVIDFSGQKFDAEVYAVDTLRDVAVLKVKRRGRAILVDTNKPSIGSHVCALGNPFGLGVSFSCGVVSATGRKNIGFNPVEDFIQTDAAVNPGASGGLLINSAGKGLGLIDAIFTKSEDSDAGVNFAVSAKLIDRVLSAWADKSDVFTH